MEALGRDETEERKIDKLPNSGVCLNYHGAHCPEPPDLNHIDFFFRTVVSVKKTAPKIIYIVFKRNLACISKVV